MTRRLKILSFIVLSGILLAGCGRSGPTRHQLSGAVTYDGKPVPAGIVMFDPDASQGNKGPQGFALIKNGHFDTSARGGKGFMGGPHRIQVFGYDGVDITETQPYGKRMFPDYVFVKDFPRGESTVNIEVPMRKLKK
jgi:hypothetical protein